MDANEHDKSAEHEILSEDEDLTPAGVYLSMLDKQLLRENNIARTADSDMVQLKKQAKILMQRLCQRQQPQVVLTQEKPPKLEMLRSTGAAIMTKWLNKLEDFNVRVKRFRLSHPYYVPRLSDFVTPETWVMISEDMLDNRDATEDGPPNDDAVDDFLRGEGRYAKQGKRGRMRRADPL